MDHIELWTTRMPLHRELWPSSDEELEGTRRTSFLCPGDGIPELFGHYTQAARESDFRPLDTVLGKDTFCLTLEKEDLLLTVSAWAHGHEELDGVLLTFSADHAQMRPSSRFPTPRIDAFGHDLAPLPGSVPDAYEDDGTVRTYRFVAGGVTPRDAIVHFRRLCSERYTETDAVDTGAALALSLERADVVLKVAAWEDAAYGTRGTAYSITASRK